MLDVHVLISEDTPKAWLDLCLSSVRAAVISASFPVALHLVDGVKGHIGRARANGYAKGSYPYVTFVDDDDYVLRTVFEQLHEPLTAGYDAVFTPEIQLMHGKLSPGLRHHHLIALRREHLIKHEDWVCCGDVAQMLAAEHSARTADAEQATYVHRVRLDSRARLLRAANAQECRRVYERHI